MNAFTENKNMTHSKQLLKSESGQGLIEYLMIVALVGIATMAIMRTVGHSITTKFAKVAVSLGADADNKSIENGKVTKTQHEKKSLRTFMQGTSEDDK